MLSKEEESMRRVGQLMLSFGLVIVMFSVGSIVFDIYDGPPWVGITIAVFKLVFLTLLCLLPRRVLSTSFMLVMLLGV